MIVSANINHILLFIYIWPKYKSLICLQN